MFISKKFPGPAQSYLDFIVNEEEFFLLTKTSQALQVMLRRHVDSPFGLERFNQDGTRGFADGSFHGFQVILRDILETRDQRFKALVKFLLPRSRQGPQGSPVKRFQKGDNFEPARSEMVLAVFSSKLDGCLVGLGPAVAEENSVGKRIFCQQPGQLDLRLDMIKVGDMQQLPSLFADGLHDLRVTMAQVADADPGHKVKVLFPLYVPNLASLPFDQDHGQTTIGLGQNFLRNFDQVFVGHCFPFLLAPCGL